MDAGAHKLLESAVQRTLHAHAFSRSSSQASAVLTDLLSRYLSLLASTCAKYAQHAGRRGLTIRDAAGAFEDLGVSVDELSEYCATEGRELNRYALYSARRVEDLLEFRSQLADGLRQDRDDAIPLVYERVPSPLLEEMDSDDEEEEEDADGMDVDTHDSTLSDGVGMDVDGPSHRPEDVLRKRPPSRPTSPTLPLSPISNPSSPLRRKSRNSNWDPPEHIPDHLPPFPSTSHEQPATQPEQAPAPHPMLPPTQLPEVKIEKPAVQIPQSLTTTAAASDYLVQVPYSQSSLSTTPEWHLPSGPPPSPPPTVARQNRLPIPQIEPSLLAAYHHILTHPPPPELPPLTPARHKVAMALLQQSLTNSRWTPSDSLFGTIGPCPPRVATIGPSYPIAVGDTPGEGPEKETKLPPTISRPVSAIERLAPLVSQQTSQIPELARQVLPPTILSRTSRLSHPPVLHRGTKPLTYGPGIPAPWNANAITTGPDGAPVATPVVSKPKDKEKDKDKDGAPTTNGKEGPAKPVLPDAKLYATWDYESKDFRVPLVSGGHGGTRGRARMGSAVGLGGGSGSGLISLPGSLSRKGTNLHFYSEHIIGLFLMSLVTDYWFLKGLGASLDIPKSTNSSKFIQRASFSFLQPHRAPALPSHKMAASISLSKAEKSYIQAGLLANPPTRGDGRAPADFRTISLQTSVAPLANGSARVSIGRNPHDGSGGTEVMAAAKLEVESVEPGTGSEGVDGGRVVCTVTCSPSAYPHLSSTALDELQYDLTTILHTTLTHPSLHPNNLTILPSKKSWLLNLDLVVLSDEGNVYDALFLAARAALWDTKVPRTRSVEYKARGKAGAGTDTGKDDVDMEEEEEVSGFDTRQIRHATDFELPDYWDEGEELDGRDRWPVCVTLNIVPPVHILDATLEEEAAIPLRLLLMFSFESAQPQVQGMRTLGNGELTLDQLRELLKEGEKYARDMWQSLNAKLKDEELSRLKERNRF